MTSWPAEQRHRRIVLLALGALLVLSISPVFGHHVVRAVDWLPASLEHVGPFCMVALHYLLSPVHEGFHYLLIAGISYAAFERSRAAWRVRQHLRVLDREPGERHEALARAARRLAFPLRDLWVVDGLPNPAFTAGWWSPRIYVAKSLLTLLPDEELEAVLAHEVAHVRRRDPLRLFVLRALASTLFWLPAIRRLADDLADEAEVAADDAVRATHRLPLASAILRVAGAQVEQERNGLLPVLEAVGFHKANMMERRIRRLAGESPLVVSHVSRRSIAAAALALVAVWASGVMVLHPLPTDDAMEGHAMVAVSAAMAPAVTAGHDPSHATSHCERHAGSLWTHLFCQGRHATADPCPHTVVMRTGEVSPG